MQGSSFHIAALATCLWLAACQSGARAPVTSGPEAGAQPSVSIASVGATQAYTEVGRLVHRCWLNPREPLLTDHEYRGEASPDGTAQILLAEKTPTGNLRAFAIVMQPRLGGGTDLRADNYRIPEPLGAKLTADVARWQRGDMTCLFDN